MGSFLGFQEGFVEALIPQSSGTNGQVRGKKQRLKGMKINIAKLIRSLAEPQCVLKKKRLNSCRTW